MRGFPQKSKRIMFVVSLLLPALLVVLCDSQLVYVMNRGLDNDLRKRQVLSRDWRPQRFGKRMARSSPGKRKTFEV